MEKKNEMTIFEKNAMLRINQLIEEYCEGSQQRFAEKTQLNKASVSQYVNGKNVPSSITAGKIADIFHINPAWLMGFDVPMKSVTPAAVPADQDPDSLDLSELETRIVRAYRNASDDTQIAVCAVLGVKRDTELRTERSLTG